MEPKSSAPKSSAPNAAAAPVAVPTRTTTTTTGAKTSRGAGGKSASAAAAATTTTAITTSTAARSGSAGSPTASNTKSPESDLADDDAARRAQITERNRIAQQQSRARKRKELEDLRHSLGNTESKLREAHAENERLRHGNAELLREVERLRAMNLGSANADLDAGELARRDVDMVRSVGLDGGASPAVPPLGDLEYAVDASPEAIMPPCRGSPGSGAAKRERADSSDRNDGNGSGGGGHHGKVDAMVSAIKEARSVLESGGDLRAVSEHLVTTLHTICPMSGQTSCSEMAKACMARVRGEVLPLTSMTTTTMEGEGEGEDAPVDACQRATGLSKPQWFTFVNETLKLTDTHRRAILAHRDEIVRRLDRIFTERHRLSRELMEALKEQRRATPSVVTSSATAAATTTVKTAAATGKSATLHGDHTAQRAANERVQAQLSRMQINLRHEREARMDFFRAMTKTLTPEQVTRIFLASVPSPPSFLCVANLVNAHEEALRKSAVQSALNG
jgi:hypothetical protein